MGIVAEEKEKITNNLLKPNAGVKRKDMKALTISNPKGIFIINKKGGAFLREAVVKNP